MDADKIVSPLCSISPPAYPPMTVLDGPRCRKDRECEFANTCDTEPDCACILCPRSSSGHPGSCSRMMRVCFVPWSTRTGTRKHCIQWRRRRLGPVEHSIRVWAGCRLLHFTETRAGCPSNDDRAVSLLSTRSPFFFLTRSNKGLRYPNTCRRPGQDSEPCLPYTRIF